MHWLHLTLWILICLDNPLLCTYALRHNLHWCLSTNNKIHFHVYINFIWYKHICVHILYNNLYSNYRMMKSIHLYCIIVDTRIKKLLLHNIGIAFIDTKEMYIHNYVVENTTNITIFLLLTCTQSSPCTGKTYYFSYNN